MIVLLQLLVTALAMQAQTGGIQGVVVEFGTNRPLAGVTVQAEGARSDRFSAETAPDGTFALRNLQEGSWVVLVTRTGYVPVVVGQQETNPQLARQTVPPGQMLSGLRIVLTPAGTIYGRIVDDRGESVVAAEVQALKASYGDGQRVLKPVQSTVTNDLGEYRLFTLPPGQYYVSVRPTLNLDSSSPIRINSVSAAQPGMLERTPPNESTGRPEAFPFYFPGTIDPAVAQPIDLHPGESRGGVDVLSAPSRMRRVRGTVQGARETARVILSPRTASSVKVGTVTTITDAEGGFEIPGGVVPGSYTIAAIYGDLKATATVDIGNADVQNLRLSLADPHRIPVQVRIDGHPEGSDPDLERIYFLVRPDLQTPGFEADNYSPFANGAFSLQALSGRYWIEKTQPENMYVKAMRLGTVDVVNDGILVDGPADSRLEILMGLNPGYIEGRLEGRTADRKITVVLVPDAPGRFRRDLYRSVTPDSSGGFLIENVPPGAYKIFAWEEENGGPWLDPEYLRKYEDRGTPVVVRESNPRESNSEDRRSQIISVIPVPN